MAKGNNKLGKVIALNIIMPILIVVLIAACLFAIIDGMVNIIESNLAKVTEIAGNFIENPIDYIRDAITTMRNWVDANIGIGDGIFNPDALSIQSLRRPSIVVSQNDFDNIKLNLDSAQVDRDAIGLEDYMLKVMLLSYYRSVYLSDFDIIIEITEEEKKMVEELNNEAASDPEKYPCPFEIVEGDTLTGIGEDGKWYLKTSGMIIIETTVEDLNTGVETEKQLKYYNKAVIDDLYNQYITYKDIRPQYAYSLKEFLKTTYTNSTSAYGEIMICTIDDTQKQTIYNYDDPKIEDYTISETIDGALKYTPINYDIVAAKYGTPVEFLLNLLEITGSKDFVNAFISLAASNEYYIKIGLYDLTSRTTNIVDEKYLQDTVIEGTIDIDISYSIQGLMHATGVRYPLGSSQYSSSILDDGSTLIVITEPSTTGKSYYLYVNGRSGVVATTIERDFNNDGVNESVLGWIENFQGEGTYPVERKKENSNVTVTTIEVINEHTYNTGIKEVKCWWAKINKDYQQTNVVGYTNVAESGKTYIESKSLADYIDMDALEELFDESKGYISGTESVTINPEEFLKADNPNLFERYVEGLNTGRNDLINKVYKEIINDSSVDYKYSNDSSQQATVESLVGQYVNSSDEYDYNKISLSYKNATRSDIMIERTVHSTGGAITGDYDIDKVMALLKDNSGEPREYKDIYTKNSKTAPGEMLENGAEMLFELLDSSQNTEGLSEVMRYILYMYNGKDYGVTSFNFGPFELEGISVDTVVIGGSIEDKVWCTLISKGYSPEAVAAVMGNIYAESRFDPSIIEVGSGAGFGLCQWTGSRRAQLEGYAAAKGVSPSDINTQIEFLVAELTPGGGARGYAKYQLLDGNGYTPNDWKNATTVEEATKAFCFTFERPDPTVAHVDTRVTKAKEYYETYKNKKMEDITGTNEIQLKIAEIAKNSARYGIKTVSGRCLAWVNDVYQEAGIDVNPRTCCAFCSGYKYGVSKDFSNVPIGAAIYTDSSTTLGKIYGHVGIYLGDGLVADNVGYVRISTLEKFISGHSARCWGWTTSTPVNASYPITVGLINKGKH